MALLARNGVLRFGKMIHIVKDHISCAGAATSYPVQVDVI
jgi:hypothetical protein